MKILITGGAGFVGSHLAEALASKHELYLVDNLATGKITNLSELVRQGHHAPVSQDSIVDYDAMANIFGRFRPDVVVHAAAAYKDPADWVEDAATNVVGTANIARLAEAHQVRRVIYFQTSLCYGLRPAISPIPVEYPCNPEGTSYAITKTSAEQLLFLSKLDVVSFRLANHYGPRNISGPIPTFYNRLSQGKSCFVMDTRRDFVYVSDLIRLVCRAIAGEGNRGYYNVSSGKDFHIRELYDAVRLAMGLAPDPEVRTVPRGEDDAATLLIDPSKTCRDFPGWQVETSLTSGITSAVKWYADNPVEQTYTHLKMKE